MIKVIIFDMGGVVVNRTDHNVPGEIARSFAVLLEIAKQAYEEALGDKAFEKGVISEEEVWQRISNFLNKPLPQDYKTIFIKQMRITHLQKEVLDIVNILKKNGYITPILSNTCKPHVEYHKKHGDYHLFSPLILSCEVGFAKPQQEIYTIALTKINCRPEEAVFIDDMQKYVDGANAVGIHGLLFQNAEQLIEDLRKLGVKI